MHTHASRGVAVLVSGGRFEISYPQGAARTDDVQAGTVRWIDPGTTHALKNVGDAPIEIVDVELK
jgi:quercetin dioxygenase-like cupin family protein